MYFITNTSITKNAEITVPSSDRLKTHENVGACQNNEEAKRLLYEIQ